MTELALVKSPYGIFPHDPDSEEWLQRVKVGTVIRAKFSKVRNALFHRKFMALIKTAFDIWEETTEPEPVETRYGTVTPERNFNEFRYWLTIKAGFYTTVAYPDGAVRVRAKSIKFASMEESEFEALYSKVLDVILRDVLSGYDRQDLEQAVARIIQFT